MRKRKSLNRCRPKHCTCEARVACLRSGGPEAAPKLNNTLLNVAINGAGIAGTSWLFQRDLKARQRDKTSVEREEALARLQVSAPLR